MGKLLLASADWMFIVAIVAFALLVAVLLVIYFRVKRRVDSSVCGLETCQVSEEGAEHDFGITAGAEDGFVAASTQEMAACDHPENAGGEILEETESSGEPSGKDEADEIAENDEIDFETVPEEDGFRFYVKDEGGKVLGASEIYKSRAGALKGIKSLVNYRDAEIGCEDDGKPCPKFELFKQGERFGYRLLSKNHAVKLSWADFEDEQSCLDAIETIKNLIGQFDT